ncbi:MAG: FUSC family protein [Streptosporangiaceae bacterium]
MARLIELLTRARAAIVPVSTALRTVTASRLPVVAELRRALLRLRAWAWRGRGTPPGFRTMKTTLAAVSAYVVALLLPGEAQPILAPLTALLVVQITLYATVKNGIDRVGAVVAGVLVALAVSNQVGLTWWSLGIVIFGALAIGRLLRLGPFLMETAISGMLVLAVANQQELAFFRVYETLIGAGVGILVNGLLAPPVYVHAAAEAVGDLATHLGGVLRRVSDEVAMEWTRDRAGAWYQAASDLDRSVRRARDAVARGEESLRMNPRGRHLDGVAPSLAGALAALEHTTIQTREICRALADRVDDLPEGDEPGEVARVTMSVLLADLADVADAFGELVEPVTSSSGAAEATLRSALARTAAHRGEASHALLVDGRIEPGIWRVHGGMLVNVDRFADELHADRGRRARIALSRQPSYVSAARSARRRAGRAARRRGTRKMRIVRGDGP